MSKSSAGSSRATAPGSGGWPSTTGGKSGGGRTNAPPAQSKK